MEALGRLLLKAQDEGFIMGFKVGERGLRVRKSFISFLLMTLLFYVRPLRSKLLIYVGSLCGSKPFWSYR